MIVVNDSMTIEFDPTSREVWPEKHSIVTSASAAIQDGYSALPALLEHREGVGEGVIYHHYVIVYERPAEDSPNPKVKFAYRLGGWSRRSIGNLFIWGMWLSRFLTLPLEKINPFTHVCDIRSIGFECDMDRKVFEWQIGLAEKPNG